MSQASSPELLTLHAVRVLGFADNAAAARRFDLDPAIVDEYLLDAQANGWLTHASFAGTAGWSLTERGRSENERQLAAELARTGHSDGVRDAYAAFLPQNGLLLRAVTDWQLRPEAGNRLSANDHTDPTWDGAVLTTLHDINRQLRPLADRLAAVLLRFSGYAARFDAALTHARAGKTAWVDRTDVDSCHRVWFELHEDLVATLGINRGDAT